MKMNEGGRDRFLMGEVVRVLRDSANQTGGCQSGACVTPSMLPSRATRLSDLLHIF